MSNQGESRMVSSGKHVRVLVDNVSQKIYTIPDFKGDDPDKDVLLLELITRIRAEEGPRDITIGGSDPDRVLFRVDALAWEDEEYRNKVIEEIRAKNKHTGIGDDFYQHNDYYREEASKCFNRHGNPDAKKGCIDYMTPAKVLGNPLQSSDDLKDLTYDQRKDLAAMRSQVMLCHFCPYHTNVRQKRAGAV